MLSVFKRNDVFNADNADIFCLQIFYSRKNILLKNVVNNCINVAINGFKNEPEFSRLTKVTM